MGGVQLADNVQTIKPRHGNVDDRHVRYGIVDLLYGFMAISRFCNHCHVAGFFY
jgi:hypothetical protein